MRGTGLVLTYGPGEGGGAQEAHIQQFRAPDQASESQNKGQIGRNLEESDPFGCLLSTRSRKWKRDAGLRITNNLSDS